MRHFLYFLKLLREGRRADIIFAQDPVSVGLPACLAAFVLRKRFILKVVGDYAWEQHMQNHDYITPEKFQGRYSGIVTGLRKVIQKNVARNAERIIVPSAYLKRIVSMWGIPKKRIVVVYNAVHAKEITAKKSELRSLLSIEASSIIR